MVRARFVLRSAITTPPDVRWATVALHPKFPWPSSVQLAIFRGVELTFHPAKDNLYPRISFSLKENALTDDEAFNLLRSLTNALVWLNREQAQIIGIYLGRTIAKVDKLLGARFIGSLPPIDLTNLPEPDDQKAQLALALYREALELNVPAYQFLGFFKILNVIHASGSAQIIWINKTIEKLSGAGASRIIDIRTNLGPSDTIGNYLFVSGRCSIAHAYGNPIVNPDRSVDIRRIDDDPCVIRQLAEIAMNEELRIKKRFDSVDS